MKRQHCVHLVNLFILFGLFLHENAYAQIIFNRDALTSLKIIPEKEVNSANMESSPCFFGDKIAYVFAGRKGKLFDEQIDDAYFELGYSTVSPDNSMSGRINFPEQINSTFHEGPLAYDSGRNRLLFTRSHREKRRLRNVETDTFYLRIMQADLNYAKPEVTPIAINATNYSVCHPSLSHDGNAMVFASNKPGGFGKMDMYQGYYNGQEWGGILNAGNQINSPFNEVFPYLLHDTLIIFASDRPGGFGGLDLYAAILKNGSWSSPELLPAPFNSPFDDLGLIVRDNGRSGYFSSSRPGGKGKDDIYRFSSDTPIFNEKPVFEIATSLQVLDKLTLEPITEVMVTVIPLANDFNHFTLSSFNVDMLTSEDPSEVILKLRPKEENSGNRFISDTEGKIDFNVVKNKKYLLKFKAEHYQETGLIYDYDVFGSPFNMVMEPKASTPPIDQDEEEGAGEDLAAKGSLIEEMTNDTLMVLEDIYYAYNSSRIEPGAAKDLDLLYRWMSIYPEARIRLEAHTDSRGTAGYNLQLSIDRATAARKYLTNLGIDEDRINIRGYGETKLRNECRDGVICSEKKHRFNRRTEVIIENKR
jgi:outer membrane protein OmpA-like peptidoglycan-associated protein